MAMTIGACSLDLRLHGVASLKEKRSVLKPILARLRQEYGVSAAEVDHNDTWDLATLGLAVVSNDAAHAHSILEKCIDWIERERLDVELVAYDIEII